MDGAISVNDAIRGFTDSLTKEGLIQLLEYGVERLREMDSKEKKNDIQPIA